MLVLLVIAQVVQAKDDPVPAKQAPAAAMSGSSIKGLGNAHRRSDGAIVVPERISGTGHIEEDHVIVEGELSPGNSPGCMNFGGSLTFSATATYFVELAGTTPCTEHDQISVASTLTINDAVLELVLLNSYEPQFGENFDVLNWGILAGNGFAVIDDAAAPLSYPLVWDYSQLYLTGEIKVGVINIADGDLAPWDNPDGNINAADLMIAVQLVLEHRTAGALQYAYGDMNADGAIDMTDLILIQQLVMQQ